MGPVGWGAECPRWGVVSGVCSEDILRNDGVFPPRSSYFPCPQDEGSIVPESLTIPGLATRPLGVTSTGLIQKGRDLIYDRPEDRSQWMGRFSLQLRLFADVGYQKQKAGIGPGFYWATQVYREGGEAGSRRLLGAVEKYLGLCARAGGAAPRCERGPGLSSSKGRQQIGHRRGPVRETDGKGCPSYYCGDGRLPALRS